MREKENLFLRNRKFVENGSFPYEIPQLFVKNAFTGGKNGFYRFKNVFLLVLLVKKRVQMPSKIQDSFRLFKILSVMQNKSIFYRLVFS